MAEKARRPKRKISVPKACYFCKEDATPWYSDVATLHKFVTDRGKITARSTRYMAHDEKNEAKVGDLVRITETRPMSARKRWRLVEILEKAK